MSCYGTIYKTNKANSQIITKEWKWYNLVEYEITITLSHTTIVDKKGREINDRCTEMYQ